MDATTRQIASYSYLSADAYLRLNETHTGATNIAATPYENVITRGSGPDPSMRSRYTVDQPKRDKSSLSAASKARLAATNT
jgi:hypothetical protein